MMLRVMNVLVLFFLCMKSPHVQAGIFETDSQSESQIIALIERAFVTFSQLPVPAQDAIIGSLLPVAALAIAAGGVSALVLGNALTLFLMVSTCGVYASVGMGMMLPYAASGVVGAILGGTVGVMTLPVSALPSSALYLLYRAISGHSRVDHFGES